MCFTSRNPATLLLLCLAGFLCLGCSDFTSPKRSIFVTITTTGSAANLDPDGYMLAVDGKPASPVAVNLTFTITDVALGKHDFLLSGLQANCTIDGINPRSIEVTTSNTSAPTTVTFIVICGPKTGTIRVKTVSTGSEIDANGYSVLIGTVPRGNVPGNATVDIEGLAEGDWLVELGGVAANCTVDAPPFRNVTVTFGTPVAVEFSVRCVATATMQVTAATTGVDLDLTGYTISVRNGAGTFFATDTLKINGTTTITGLIAGDYLVTLDGIAPNCDAVTPNPQTVSAAQNPTVIRLEVVCEKARQIAYVSDALGYSNILVISSNDAGNSLLVANPGFDVDPAWSPDGSTLAFASGQNAAGLDVYSITADGATTLRLTQNFGAYRPAWSPDGARIAFVSERSGNAEIYIMNADGSNPVAITNNASRDTDPAWSPDGTKIAFTSERGGNIAIWVMDADGSNPKALTSNTRGDWHPAWSPDGSRIAFSRGVSANSRDIWIMNADGAVLTPLTNGLSNAQDPSWAPDGRKIVLSSESCEYYSYYGCTAVLLVVGLDGSVFSPLTTGVASYNPTWRP